MSRTSLLALAALALALAPLGCRSPGAAAKGGDGDGPELTLDWIHGPGPAALEARPRWRWRADGTLLLLDEARAAEERLFETFDPSTRARTPLCGLEEARDSLRALAGEATPDELGWPDELDEAGRRGLYAIEGELYVLELESATFARLTETPEEEEAARFSPDGARVAFVRANDLYVHDLANGAETRLTYDGDGTHLNGTLSWVYWEEIFGRNDRAYWWSPDSERVAYLATDESEVSEVTFVDFQPAVPRTIVQRYPKAGTKNPAVRVGVVAAAGGPTTWVGLDPESYEYVARVEWLPSGRELAVQTMTRDQARLDLAFVDATSGRAREVLTETDPGWVNIHDDLVFLKDGAEFLWVSERDGYAHAYRYAADGSLFGRVTRGPWALRSSSGSVFWLRRAIQHVDEARGLVYFTALEKDSIEKHLYRIHLDGTGLERLSSEEGTHAIAFSPDGGHYVDTYSTARRLPMLRVHRADGTEIERLAEPRPDALTELDLTFPVFSHIPARDGFAMPAQRLVPPDFDASRPHPVIVHVYSGPSAPMVADAWDRGLYFDNLLARAGYVVIEVDNRSSTAISKELENTVLGQLSGDSEKNDLEDALRWIGEQPWADAERIGMWGWSGGGTTTLLMMTRTDLVAAGISVAPVTDWHYYDTKWAEFAMKTPEANPEGYAHTSLVERAKDLSGRLLLVHGTYDDNVHPQNAWHFIDELIEANKPFDMMLYPMRKHGIADTPARRHLFGKMLAFWRERL